MKPFYWHGTTNFGDYLNSRIWPELLSEYLDDDDDIRLIGIGSLLKSSINRLEGKKVVFGTGSGYGAIPRPETYADWKFYFVRGPQTAKCFELPEKLGIIDGAWLISLLPQYANYHTLERKGTTFIPHWNSADSGNWAPICAEAETNYLNPLGDLDTILRSIATSELVITESLHGAILADLFRVHWLPVSISPKFLPFKWVDWYDSVGLERSMIDFPMSDFFEYVYNSARPTNISYQVDPYKIETAALSPETAPSPVKKPGRMYRMQIELKRAVRNSRRKVIAGISNARDAYPISIWNRKHRSKMAKALTEIAQLKPNLSSDQVRSEKIEQLEERVASLKEDYRNRRI